MKLFELVGTMVLPVSKVGHKDLMAQREGIKTLCRVGRIHDVSHLHDENWPTLRDIGESMYNAENKPVTVEAL